ncbi:MAG: RNA polymerase sigma factor SigZ [Nitrospira sp. WS238]|nr:RNA polymerase sigma factor SigZ [Nitrospira sp. WS238]
MDANREKIMVPKTTEELWQLLHEGLQAFIAKRVDDHGHVDDLLQEVFMRVHRQIDSVNDPRRVVSWIYQITRNTIIDHYRKPGRQREIPTGLSSEREMRDETSQKPERADRTEVEQARSELAGCLGPMIERLSQDYRDAITLVEIDGLTQQAAAMQMGISLSGMKSRVQRGRKQLKQMLQDCCLIELDRRGGVTEYHPREKVKTVCTEGGKCGETDEA